MFRKDICECARAHEKRRNIRVDPYRIRRARQSGKYWAQWKWTCFCVCKWLIIINNNVLNKQIYLGMENDEVAAQKMRMPSAWKPSHWKSLAHVISYVFFLSFLVWKDDCCYWLLLFAKVLELCRKYLTWLILLLLLLENYANWFDLKRFIGPCEWTIEGIYFPVDILKKCRECDKHTFSHRQPADGMEAATNRWLKNMKNATRAHRRATFVYTIQFVYI